MYDPFGQQKYLLLPPGPEQKGWRNGYINPFDHYTFVEYNQFTMCFECGGVGCMLPLGPDHWHCMACTFCTHAKRRTGRVGGQG